MTVHKTRGDNMASVTEDSLNIAAHEVVAGFVDVGTDLTSGVRKKASELGLNREQTARLIERTNSEAFLRVFPEKTDFAVADPGALLTSSEKTASVHTPSKTTYAEYLNRDPYDIFGVENIKTASYAEHSGSYAKEKLLDMVYTKALQEAAQTEKTAKLLAVEDAQAQLWNVVKTAAYSGTSVASMERELLLAFPERPLDVIDMVDSLTEKLASSLLSPEIMKRAAVEDFDANAVVTESELTRAFKEVMDVAK